MSETVAVLGASDKPDRYSNKAVRMLLEYNHKVVPVHPGLKEVEGLPVVASLEQIGEPVDTLTVYVGPAGIGPLIPSVIGLKPGRVILNPGTEDEGLMAALTGAGIPFQQACTLVLLRTNQF